MNRPDWIATVCRTRLRRAAEQRIFAVLACLPLLGGCAGPAASTLRSDACRALLENVDRAIAGAGAANTAVARIPGFPHLRADRFLASFAGDPLSVEGYALWLEKLQNLGNGTRTTEWSNLSTQGQDQVRSWLSPGQDPTRLLEQCATRLTQGELNSATRRADLARAIRVPDAYSDTARVLGLYPLLKWPFVDGVFRLHRELRAAYANPPEPEGRLQRYAPPLSEALNREQVADILRRASRNALELPEPDETDLDRLFAAFAPVWEVDTRDEKDQIGTLHWGSKGMPQVDTTQPMVYRLASHTHFHGQILLQLNYMAWFPARAPEQALDMYAGALDGLVWRVTLSPRGEPLAYDTIHPCGCYYQVFPGPGYRVTQPEDGGEPVLSPFPIGRVRPGHRLRLRLASRTHFIQGVTVDSGERPKSHGWTEYRALLSLPNTAGRRSLFDTEGFVAGSERGERFLFWPMGVANAGAMRQWGRHAITFVGRRHFDDARLFEQILLPLPPADRWGKQ